MTYESVSSFCDLAIQVAFELSTWKQKWGVLTYIFTLKVEMLDSLCFRGNDNASGKEREERDKEREGVSDRGKEEWEEKDRWVGRERNQAVEGEVPCIFSTTVID